MTCQGCGGTFYPQSIGDIEKHRVVRLALFLEPERWHLTEALEADLTNRLTDLGPVPDLGINPVGTMLVFGVPRCEHDLFN